MGAAGRRYEERDLRSPRRSGDRPFPARPFGLLALLLALLVVPVACASGTSADLESRGPEPVPQVGPVNGALVVAGGGALGQEVWERFVELAGGPDAHIVVIPTAGTIEEFPEDWAGLADLRRAGAGRLTILHTRDPDEADSEAFVEPLLEATGVWIPGGRQWRLVDAYLHTRVHDELFELLDRGGVIGGTSAGASIQASYLVRGDPETNQIMMSPGYEEGFGFLLGAAVDQHLLARDRENDLWDVLQIHPDLLGIGLDEGTAMVIQGNRAEVIGSSMALVYSALGPFRTPRVLRSGEIFDLGRRVTIPVAVEEDRDGAGPSG